MEYWIIKSDSYIDLIQEVKRLVLENWHLCTLKPKVFCAKTPDMFYLQILFKDNIHNEIYE